MKLERFEDPFCQSEDSVQHILQCSCSKTDGSAELHAALLCNVLIVDLNDYKVKYASQVIIFSKLRTEEVESDSPHF